MEKPNSTPLDPLAPEIFGLMPPEYLLFLSLVFPGDYLWQPPEPVPQPEMSQWPDHSRLDDFMEADAIPGGPPNDKAEAQLMINRIRAGRYWQWRMTEGIDTS